jgi:hypothetical protein
MNDGCALRGKKNRDTFNEGLVRETGVSYGNSFWLLPNRVSNRKINLQTSLRRVDTAMMIHLT